MPSIFLSFVHEDEAVARATKELIQAELKDVGEVFLSSDKQQVYAGDVWIDKITLALEEAAIVILLLSKRSVGRPWVNFEAGGAWLKRKKIIPCCFGKLAKDALPHPYSAVQAVNLGDKMDMHYLLTSIHHHLKLGSPPLLGPQFRASEKSIRAKEAGFEGAFDYTDKYGMLKSAIDECEDID